MQIEGGSGGGKGRGTEGEICIAKLYTNRKFAPESEIQSIARFQLSSYCIIANPSGCECTVHSALSAHFAETVDQAENTEGKANDRPQYRLIDKHPESHP